MNGDEVVYESLRKHGSDEEGWRCLRHCGTDNEELQKALREHDADEAQRRTRQVLRKCAVDEAMQEARQRKAALDSIAESSIWKDPQFLTELSRNFMAKDFEKSRETTKHYIDSPGQPARAPNISKMGHPKRGRDGQIVRDMKGQIVWDTTASEEQQANRIAVHLRNTEGGQNCATCIAYRNQSNPCPIVGATTAAATMICDKFAAKTADGRIDTTKSVMGIPVRNPDGTISWVAK